MTTTLKYYPRPAKVALATAIAAAIALVCLLTCMRGSDSQDPALISTLVIADSDPDSAIRSSARKAYARHLAGDEDRSRSILDTDTPENRNALHGVTAAVLVILAMSATVFFIYRFRLSSLRYRLDKLKADNESMSHAAAELSCRIAEAEARAADLGRELANSRDNSHTIYLELQKRQQKLAESEAAMLILSERLRKLSHERESCDRLSPDQTRQLFAPYISAIDNIIRSADITGIDTVGPLRACEREIKALVDYLRSDSFTASLPLTVAICEPGITEAMATRLGDMLDKQSFDILMMIIVGFSSPTIITITGLSRSSLYRRRDSIADRLLDSANDHLISIADRYIRRAPKTPSARSRKIRSDGPIPTREI